MAEEPTAPETPENPEAAEAASAPEMEAAEAPMPMPVPEEETGADAGNEGGQTVASGKMPTPEGSSEAPAPAAGGEAATGDEGEGAEEAEAPTDKSGLIVAIIAPVVLIPLCYFLVKPLVTQQVAHASATFLAVKTNYLAKKAELDAGRQHAAEIAKGHAWGYTTTNGPVRWAELGYPLAYRGQRQSPIDIREAQVIDASGLPPLQFDYHDGPLDMAHTGHTIQITPKTASSIIIDGRVYRLAQFHFHTPSEHFYNGQPYPMEVHLVHVLDENATGNILPAGDLGNAGPGAAPDKPFADKTKKTTASKQLAVIGIFIREGAAPHPYATKLINAMPTSPMAQRTLVGQGLNPAQLLPANHSYYRYHGSLTTPPLTENVLWTVLSKPIEFSIEQIEVFKKLFPTDKKNLGNARPPQPLGRRFVVHHRAPATTNTPPAPTPTNSPPAVTIKPPLPTLTNAPPVATNTPPVPIPTNTPPAATNITPLPTLTNTPPAPISTNTPPAITNAPPIVTNEPPLPTPPVVTNITSPPLVAPIPAPDAIANPPLPAVTFAELEIRPDKLAYHRNQPFTGKVLRTHRNGRRASETHYRDGRPHGSFTKWFDSGDKEYQGQHKDGKRDGLHTSWWPNGQKAAEIAYVQDKPVNSKLWDEQGKPIGN